MKKIIFIFVIFTASFLPLAVGACTDDFDYGFGSGMMNMMGFGGGFGSFNFFGWLSSIVWLVVGIFAAVWLWRQIKK